MLLVCIALEKILKLKGHRREKVIDHLLRWAAFVSAGLEMSSPIADFKLLNDYSCKARLSHLLYNLVRPECNCAACRPFGTIYGQSVNTFLGMLPPTAKSTEDIEKVYNVLSRTPLTPSRLCAFAAWAVPQLSSLSAKELSVFVNKNWNGVYLTLPLENGGGVMAFSERGIKSMAAQALVAFVAAEKEALRPNLVDVGDLTAAVSDWTVV